MGLEDLFGGSNKIDILTGKQKRLLNEISKMALDELGKSPEVYGGTVTPGVTQSMQAAFDYAPNLLGGDTSARQAAVADLMSGRGDLEGVNQYYTQSVLNPARQAFGDALRQIDARYGDTWGATGAHQRAVGDATARFGTGIASVLGDVVLQDRNLAAGRQAQGVGLDLAGRQDEMSRLGALFGLGDAERQIQGQQLGEDYNRWLSGQWYNNPALGLAGLSLGTQGHAMGQTAGMIPGVTNTLLGGLQVGGGLMGLFG